MLKGKFNSLVVVSVYKNKKGYKNVSIIDNGFTRSFNCSDKFYNLCSEKLKHDPAVKFENVPFSLEYHKGYMFIKVGD